MGWDLSTLLGKVPIYGSILMGLRSERIDAAFMPAGFRRNELGAYMSTSVGYRCNGMDNKAGNLLMQRRLAS
jgi:hypothetical protein